MKQLFSIFIFALFISATSHAGTYKWLDKDGNVVYSQRPPADGQYESIHVKPPPRKSSDGNSASQNSEKFLNDATTQRKHDAKIKDELKKTQALRDKNCATAKKQLEFYNVYRRKKDKNGEYVRIDDAEKVAGLKEAKQGIKDFCD